MPDLRSNIAIHAFAASLGFLLAACQNTDREADLPFEEAQPFSGAGETPPGPEWWTTFDDPELNRLVERAIADNFDLASAWERLREARAVARRAGADLYPELDAEADAESTRRVPGADNETLGLGLSAGYEVDLWGRIDSQVDAARLRAEATRADYRTALVSLTAEIARTWYRLREARAQIALIRSQETVNEQALESLETRFTSGQGRSADILRQRQLVESTREERISAESELRVLEHQLAVLLGETPQDATLAETAEPTLPDPPPLPDTGLPAELVRDRTDIRAAHLRLRAADEELAAAAANRLPRLTLAASLDTTESDARELFDDWVRTLAANLVAPIIDGGRRRAEVERTGAVRRRRLNEYAQTVLTAFREVEDALVREAKQRERIENLVRQVELSEKTTGRIRSEFINGVGDFLDLLTARTDTQQLQRELLTARRNRIEFRIALHRALASGSNLGGDSPAPGGTTTPSSE